MKRDIRRAARDPPLSRHQCSSVAAPYSDLLFPRRQEHCFLHLSGMVPSIQTVGGVFCQVFDKAVQLVTAMALLGLAIAVLGQPEEDGKPRTSSVGGTPLAVAFIFTMNDSAFVLHLGAKPVEDGRQLLALPAPRRVEINQRVLAVVGDHTIQVLTLKTN